MLPINGVGGREQATRATRGVGAARAAAAAVRDGVRWRFGRCPVRRRGGSGAGGGAAQRKDDRRKGEEGERSDDATLKS
jgi:hypothetical protein